MVLFHDDVYDLFSKIIFDLRNCFLNNVVEIISLALDGVVFSFDKSCNIFNERRILIFNE